MNTARYFILVAIWGLLPYRSLAQPGTLDPTFGNGGVVQTDLGTSELVSNLAIQLDGAILVGGRQSSGGCPQQALVVRYTPDGTLDPQFGTGGYINLDFPFGCVDVVSRILVRPDGRLALVGWSLEGSTGEMRFALAQLHPDGSLDTSFGANGYVVTDQGASWQTVDGVLQPDGKVVVAGYTEGAYHIVLARYEADGSLDTGFGAGGVVVTGTVVEQITRSLALLADGKIVVGAQALLAPGGSFDYGVFRYTPEGQLDPQFGGGGYVLTDVSTDRLQDLAVQPDGKVVAAGATGSGTTFHPTLVRYNADGTLDGAFGEGGVARYTAVRIDPVFGRTPLLYQPDGKLVTLSPQASGTVTYAVRFMPDGSVDPTFGTGGRASSEVGGSLRDAELQPDGKIVAAGSTNANDIVVVRYLNDVVGTATEEDSEPRDLSLAAYPNPAVGEATVSYQLDGPGHARLAVYDVLGREVAVLDQGVRAAGEHTASLNASELRPGIYLLRLTTEVGSATRRLTVLH